jgi:N-acetylglucosaminyl-diphospho-decaprenol L-rhamnosyltransferase
MVLPDILNDAGCKRHLHVAGCRLEVAGYQQPATCQFVSRTDLDVISIIIVNWNSGQLLEKCVRSLLNNAPGSQIVIVDNASSDLSLRSAEKIQGELLIMRNTRNIGYAAANNIGWRASTGDRILFLNPDTECFPESVDFLEQTLAADSGVWAAGGQLVGPARTPQARYAVRAFPSVRSVAAEMLFIDEIWPSNPWSGPKDCSPGTTERDVDQPAAACLMLCRDALEATEGFDEDFSPAWFEDVDLCRRIRNEGGRIRYQPKARFLHHGGSSLGTLSRKDFLEFFHRNQIRYFRKHHGPRDALQVKRLIVTGLFMRSALSLVFPLAPNLSRMASAKTFWDAARRIMVQREAIS